MVLKNYCVITTLVFKCCDLPSYSLAGPINANVTNYLYKHTCTYIPESGYVIIDQAQLMPHKFKLNLFKSLIIAA